MKVITFVALVLLLLSCACLDSGSPDEYTVLGINYDMPEMCEVAAGGYKRAYTVIEMGGIPGLAPPLILDYPGEGPDVVAGHLVANYTSITPMPEFTQEKMYYGSWEPFQDMIPEWGHPSNMTMWGIDEVIMGPRIDTYNAMLPVVDMIVEERPDIIIGGHQGSTFPVAKAARQIAGAPVGAVVFDAHVDSYHVEEEIYTVNGSLPIQNSWVVGTAIVEGDLSAVMIMGTMLKPTGTFSGHALYDISGWPMVGGEIEFSSYETIQSGDETKEVIEGFFSRLKDEGIEDIIISIDMDVLEKRNFHGFRYNELKDVTCQVAISYLNNTPMDYNEVLFHVQETRGVSREELFRALDILYREADENNVEIVLQEITEVNPALDRNGETTRLAADLAWYMMVHGREVNSRGLFDIF